jgi:hypothetical protein
MTREQAGAVHDLLASQRDDEVILHHGDCIGADAQVHDIAISLDFWVVIHPPMAETQRAWRRGPHVRAPKAALDRNRDIVRESELLIAAPAEALEQPGSGTWSTVRYAQKLGRPVQIIMPDGSIG